MQKRFLPHHFCIAAVLGMVMVFGSNEWIGAVYVLRNYVNPRPAILRSNQPLPVHTYSVWIEVFGKHHVLKTSQDEKEIDRLLGTTSSCIHIALAVMGILLGVLCVYSIRWLWPAQEPDATGSAESHHVRSEASERQVR